MKYLIGIDEVGRGPLAGPVTVCAFCIPYKSKYVQTLIKDFNDSKRLSAQKREKLCKIALLAKKQKLVNFSIVSISASFIDKYGISRAVKKAVTKSLQNLNVKPLESKIMLDGLLRAPEEYIHQKTIIRGDQKIKVISCASVMAKVARDNLMIKIDNKYPLYGFKKHKGYGTKSHIELIKKYGPSKIHRFSFLKKI